MHLTISARRLLQGAALAALMTLVGPARAEDGRELHEDHPDRAEKTLYIWAGDAARIHPDFLAVIDFDERSPHYGRVLRTVPVPPPGNVGNEPHHCHLSVDKTILAS